MEKLVSEAMHITEFFGWWMREMSLLRCGANDYELKFEGPGDSPKSLVTINHTNEEEAKAIEYLIRKFQDVFAVERRRQPALVAPIDIEVDV
jgi:hypothetical protein